MNADLILSRSSYRAGSPVVGTVRIRRAASEANDSNTEQQTHPRPIRDDVASARVYLAGRAHLGSASRGNGTRWRSALEVAQLKKIYGEHACLTMAKVDERARWADEWRDNENAGDMGAEPKVTHVEQAERLAVHTSLHHSKAKQVANTATQPPRNDYSHLPTPHENNAVCVWMTNVLELTKLPERHLDGKCSCKSAELCRCHPRPGRGRYHGDMHPYRPLQLPDLKVVRDVSKGVEDGAGQSLGKTGDADAAPSAWERIAASAKSSNEATMNREAASAIPLEELQLAVSFRADLPPDVPPTMSAECVKYFYSAVLVVTTVQGDLLVTQCPFAVLATNSQHSPQQQAHQTSTTRVHIGDIHAIAHSAGLPTYISSTESSDATPSQLRVVANPPACDIVSRRTAEQRTSTHRIVDGSGSFCGLMTLVGIGGPLVPGTRLGIRVQFPIYDDDEMCNGARIIPCHRVCCALVGEEYAVFEGSAASPAGGDNLQKSKKRVKTRSYVFDSDYEMVDFGYTEAISMGLVLPLDCPVTVCTDLVEVTVRLKVEFIVSRTAISSERDGKGNGANGQGEEFNTIRLDLPCDVVHVDSGADGYREDGEDEERHVSSIRTMQQFWKDDGDGDAAAVGSDANGFDDTDIQSDLKMLSLRLHGDL
ncbi:hypothetical protein ACHAXT_003080 [Thalassiosira profunda]